MTPASRALLYGEDDDDDTPLTPEEMANFSAENEGGDRTSSGRWVTFLLALIVTAIVGAVGWVLWQAIEPNTGRLLPEDAETPAEVESN